MDFLATMASVCTIATLFLALLSKAFKSVSYNAKQRRLSEELDSLRKAEESLRQPHSSFTNESIYWASQKQIRENTIRYIALKEYPKSQLVIPIAVAILSFTVTVCFTGSFLIEVENFTFKLDYLVWAIECGFAWGVMCFCLAAIGERQMCLEDYAKQLRNGSFPLAPRQPQDGAQFYGKSSWYRYNLSWLVFSAFYTIVFFCIFLPTASISSKEFGWYHWLGLAEFLAIWFVGSGAVNAFLKWVYEKDFTPQYADSPETADDQETTDSENTKKNGQSSEE
ncbi:hypothetical protein ABRP78_09630 [Corynebacterium sp. KPL4064]|uniref:hypothetical protein n=1 Tax=unclassified Corynebacterium TaxID=2624378 RepID=UPI00254F81AA|nr:hypothetical protein [Corynebacterium kefirresidentii]MDK8838175.1 hypothetical protein [Corynebacterium kefirresidentii]